MTLSLRSSRRQLSRHFLLIFGLLVVFGSWIVHPAQAAPDARPLSAPNDVQGVVFLDFDHDGIRDAFEPGIGGVTVTSYSDAGLIGAVTTATITGAYTVSTVTNGTRVRIEITNYPAYLQPGSHNLGAGNGGTTVVYANGGDTGVNIALTNPARYCQSITNTTPNLMVTCFVSTLSTGYRGQSAVTQFPYRSGTASPTGNSAAASVPTDTNIVRDTDVGSVWGLAYRRSTNRLYTSAFTKRHVAYSSLTNPTSKIFILNPAAPNTVLGTIDLATIFADPNVAGPNNHDTANYTNDASVYSSVGKTALGGLSLSDDESTLYTINLFDRRLYVIPLANPNATTRVALPTPADCPLQSGVDERRPFAVTNYNGLIYIGMTCSGEQAGATAAGRARLRAYVYSYNGASFTQVLNFPLNYTRGQISGGGAPANSANWRGWSDNPAQTGGDILYFAAYDQYYNPQPLVSGITFDEQGFMILGIMDRFGHQSGNNRNTAGSGQFEGVSAGDILRFRPDNYNAPTNWNNPEANANDGWVTSGNFNGGASGGAGNNQGPGGGEFYYTELYLLTGGSNTHTETSQGAVYAVPGTGEVVESAMDPAPAGNFRAGGFIWMSNYRLTRDDASAVLRGGRTRSYEIYGLDEAGSFGKAAGTGDIEPLCLPEPIEIGNYVWFDTNNNGRQDPGESVVPNGVVVELRDAAGNLIATTTIVNGQYYFNSSNVTGGILPNTTYYVNLAASNFTGAGLLVGYTQTIPNNSINTNDSNGQTGTVPGNPGLIGSQVVTGGYGNNNHTIDFGLILTPTPTPTATNTPTDTPTNTPTVTLTPSNTPTSTPTLTFTPSLTPSNTPTETPSPTLTPSNTPTETPTLTFTPSLTPSNTPTETPSPTLTPSNTPTETPTLTFTPSLTPSNTPTDTPSPTLTPSNTPTETPTLTFTPSLTPSNTPTDTPSPTLTPSNTPTETPTLTFTPSLTPSNTPTDTPSPTLTPSNTPTETPTLTFTPSLTPSNTPTDTPTLTFTPSNTPTNTPTLTFTPSLTPSNTPTDTPSPTLTPTNTPTETPTLTFTPSLTPSNTPTDTPTLTFTPSNTPTNTPTLTFTPSLTPSNTPTDTPSPTLTPTNTPSNTPTLTFTPSLTPSNTPTDTPSPTLTPTSTPTLTFTPSLTPTGTLTVTATFTPSNTPTGTLTVTPTFTPSNTPTNTPTGTLTVTPTFTPSNTPTGTLSTATQRAPTGTPFVGVVDPALTKLGDPSLALPGELVTFVMTATNRGTAPALNVVVTDQIPSDYFTPLSATASKGTFTIAGNDVTFFIGTLNPAEVVTLTILTRVRADAPVPANAINVGILTHSTGSSRTASAPVRISRGSLPATGERPETGFPILPLTIAMVSVVIVVAVVARRRRVA